MAGLADTSGGATKNSIDPRPFGGVLVGVGVVSVVTGLILLVSHNSTRVSVRSASQLTPPARHREPRILDRGGRGGRGE